MLTWNLLHRMEQEVLDSLAAGGHPQWILDMLRAPGTPEYPYDDHAISIEEQDFTPPIFAAVDDEWCRLN